MREMHNLNQGEGNRASEEEVSCRKETKPIMRGRDISNILYSQQAAGN